MKLVLILTLLLPCLAFGQTPDFKDGYLVSENYLQEVITLSMDSLFNLYGKEYAIFENFVINDSDSSCLPDTFDLNDLLATYRPLLVSNFNELFSRAGYKVSNKLNDVVVFSLPIINSNENVVYQRLVVKNNNEEESLCFEFLIPKKHITVRVLHIQTKGYIDSKNQSTDTITNPKIKALYRLNQKKKLKCKESKEKV